MRGKSRPGTGTYGWIVVDKVRVVHALIRLCKSLTEAEKIAAGICPDQHGLKVVAWEEATAEERQQAKFAVPVIPPCRTRSLSATRYAARVQFADGRIEEIGIGPDPKAVISQAKLHHSEHRLKTWVWNVRTGETIFRLEPGHKAVRTAGAVGGAI